MGAELIFIVVPPRYSPNDDRITCHRGEPLRRINRIMILILASERIGYDKPLD